GKNSSTISPPFSIVMTAVGVRVLSCAAAPAVTSATMARANTELTRRAGPGRRKVPPLYSRRGRSAGGRAGARDQGQDEEDHDDPGDRDEHHLDGEPDPMARPADVDRQRDRVDGFGQTPLLVDGDGAGLWTQA